MTTITQLSITRPTSITLYSRGAHDATRTARRDLPDGDYPGTWSGTIISLHPMEDGWRDGAPLCLTDGSKVELTTDSEVRGMVEVIVTVRYGVPTVHSTDGQAF